MFVVPEIGVRSIIRPALEGVPIEVLNDSDETLDAYLLFLEYSVYKNIYNS